MLCLYNQGDREIDANQPPVPSHTFAKIVKQTTPNLNVKITHIPTLTLKLPVKAEKLSEELQGYDEQLKKDLLDCFTNGFSLGGTETPQPHIASNHKSTASHAEVINAHISKGLSLDCIAGTFSEPPFSPFVSSPLGIVPKSESGKVRIIHDLSYPKNNSINTNIPKENFVVQYDTIDWVINLVQQYGPYCLMAKTDIEDAFRIIPINPSDYHLLVFSWEEQFYFDKCLPM